MSRYRTIDVWNRVFGARQEAYDYAGRLMKKSAEKRLSPDARPHPSAFRRRLRCPRKHYHLPS